VHTRKRQLQRFEELQNSPHTPRYCHFVVECFKNMLFITGAKSKDRKQKGLFKIMGRTNLD